MDNQAKTMSDADQEAGRRHLGLTGWALLGFAAILAISIFLTGWQEALDAFGTLDFNKIMTLCALVLGHYVIRGFRWHTMVRVGGVLTSWRVNLLHFFAGFAMTATPGRVGELVRLRWLRRETGRGFGHLLPIAFADRAIELASMVGLIVLALSQASLGTSATWWVLLAGGILVWITCRPQALLVAFNLAYRVTGRRWPKLFVRLRRLTRRLGPFMRLPVFLPVLIAGIVGWGLEGLAFWYLLGWLGADITLAAAVSILLVSILSGALSGLPGGLGGTEAAALALLLLQGVPLETAVIATAVIRVVTLWFAVAIGITVMPFAEARARRG